MAGKREQILAAALKLFIEKGFHNTSTANISKEAGVGTGTLFLYFPGKDVLMNELYKDCKAQMGIVLEQDFPKEGSTRDKLNHLWHRACEWAYQNNDTFRFIHMFKSSPLISNLTREEVSSSAAFAVDFFEQAMKKGDIEKMDAGLLLSVIDGLLSAAVSYIITTGGKNRKQIIERSFDIFWGGVAGK